MIMLSAATLLERKSFSGSRSETLFTEKRVCGIEDVFESSSTFLIVKLPQIGKS
jgi:hypothetical protein